jgi:hypothetical protein
MRSTLSRRSESSTVDRICSGRLSSPVELLPSKEKPNLVAITTRLWTGAKALPTSSSLLNGVDLSGIEEGDAEIDGTADQGDAVLLVEAGP